MRATFAIYFFPGVTFKSKKETGDSNFNITYFNLPNMFNLGSFQCLINKIYLGRYFIFLFYTKSSKSAMHFTFTAHLYLE